MTKAEILRYTKELTSFIRYNDNISNETMDTLDLDSIEMSNIALNLAILTDMLIETMDDNKIIYISNSKQHQRGVALLGSGDNEDDWYELSEIPYKVIDYNENNSTIIEFIKHRYGCDVLYTYESNILDNLYLTIISVNGKIKYLYTVIDNDNTDISLINCNNNSYIKSAKVKDSFFNFVEASDKVKLRQDKCIDITTVNIDNSEYTIMKYSVDSGKEAISILV